jgi:hypothetical protein
MGTIANPFYRIKYQIITNGTNPSPDPPQSVGPIVTATVNAATLNAAIAALSADLSISGSQRLSILEAQQIHQADTVYN